MAEVPRSSFIPKQSSSAVPSSIKRKKHFHVFSFIGGLVLIGSLAAAGGAYFYDGHVQNQLVAAKTALANERDRFSESDIATVTEFGRQIEAAKLLLNSHIEPSKVLDALEFSTLRNIQFTNFTLKQLPSRDIEIDVKGGTEAFKTLALQELAFNDNPLLHDVVFSQVSTNGASLIDPRTGERLPPPSPTDTTDSGSKISFIIVGNMGASDLSYEGTGQAFSDSPQESTSPVSGSSETGTTTDAGSTGTSTDGQATVPTGDNTQQ